MIDHGTQKGDSVKAIWKVMRTGRQRDVEIG